MRAQGTRQPAPGTRQPLLDRPVLPRRHYPPRVRPVEAPEHLSHQAEEDLACRQGPGSLVGDRDAAFPSARHHLGWSSGDDKGPIGRDVEGAGDLANWRGVQRYSR